jgi:NAD(P)-dependent dehydrogenase (short-subunit alcohol dehydrogenase family)
MSFEKNNINHHGLNLSRNPFETCKESQKGPPPSQEQLWPGSEKQMRPPADHGEECYQGGNKLLGLKALITGGDSGIGRAVAIAFAREGADVAIVYYSEHDDAEETIRWVKKADRKGIAIAADLSRYNECRRVVDQTAEQLHGINILVNNAAIHKEAARFTDIQPEALEYTFRIDIMAYFWIAQEVVPLMKSGDTIINTGSVTSLKGHTNLMDYAMAKGAVNVFTKSLAQELAPQGIRVNCVAPGPVWTPLIPSTRTPGHIGEFGADTFWHRPAQPAEIAPSYVFLASTDSRYYTGEIFAPTGIPISTR